MKILRIPLVVALIVLAGRVFNVNAQTETGLYSFVGLPSDGLSPHAGLVQGINGSFYGTTLMAGRSASALFFGSVPTAPIRVCTLWQRPQRWIRSQHAGARQRRQFLRDDRCGRDVQTTAACFGSVPAAATRIFTHLAASDNDGEYPLAGLGAGHRQQFLRDDLLAAGRTATARCFGSVPAAATRIFTPLAAVPNDGDHPGCRACAGQRRQILRDDRSGRDVRRRHRVSDQSQRQLHESLLLWQLTPTMGTNQQPGWCRAAMAISTGRPAGGGTSRQRHRVWVQSQRQLHESVLLCRPFPRRWCQSRCGAGAGQRRQFLRDDLSTAGRTAAAPCFGSVPAAAKRICTPLAAFPTMGSIHKPGWFRVATAISTGRPFSAGRTTTAPCSNSMWILALSTPTARFRSTQPMSCSTRRAAPVA